MRARSLLIPALVLALAPPAVPAGAAEAGLSGLWEARRLFGAVTEGQLLLRESGERLVAEIAGYRTVANLDDDEVSFSLPDGSRFSGEIGSGIRGHWIQPPSRLDGNVFATPVALERRADGWSGTVMPQPDTGTFYLLLKRGSAPELINPERNLGIFAGLTRLVREEDSVSLMGRFRGSGDEEIMLRGHYYSAEEVLALRFPGRGGGYDFRHVEPADAGGFLARSPAAAPLLARPPALDDGWETATPDEVGIDAAPIREMLRRHVFPAPSAAGNLSVHALLIARHGRLAVEEYFHGYHRALPHDSRSASKGVTALLAAAAMQAGIGLDWDTPVYPLFDTAGLLEREPARAAVTLRHLVNMSSGLDCDDRNADSAANEDYLWEHAGELDFYRHLLEAELVRPAGEATAYCSAGANLAGGAIAAAADENLLRLLHRLVARPLGIEHYAVPLPPDGHPYLGGGIRWRPRDLLKFPQLLLDDGAWRGHRVIRRVDARRLTTPAVTIDGGRDYGYLWWTRDYPYRGRTVRAHFMAGNGGQIAMLVPELALSLVFNAGNYSDRVMYRIQDELIPDFVLPAVRE